MANGVFGSFAISVTILIPAKFESTSSIVEEISSTFLGNAELAEELLLKINNK